MIVAFEGRSVGAQCQVTLRSQPQVPFNRARLRMAKGWTLIDFRIGNVFQSACIGESSGIYDGDGCDLGQLDPFMPGQIVELTVRNDSAAPMTFGGALFVSKVEPPTGFRPVTIRVTEEGVMVLP